MHSSCASCVHLHPPRRQPHHRQRHQQPRGGDHPHHLHRLHRLLAPASGVPFTATSALMGTDSGCTSWLASVSSISQRSSTDSPRPMMPPEHTEMPASRTRSSVSQPVLVGAGGDDLAVVLLRGVEVVVVRGQARLLEPLRLAVGEHAQRAARLHAQRAHALHHLQHRVELRAVLHLAPGGAHAEAGGARPRAPAAPPPAPRPPASASRPSRPSGSAPPAGSSAQSSGQPPVLIDSSEHSCTSLSLNTARCTVCAR